MNAPFSSEKKSSPSKSTFIAYLLWWFLGVAGMHRFYLGRIKTGCIQLILMILTFAVTSYYMTWLFLTIWFVWWLVDAFLVQKIIQQESREA